MYMYAGTTVPAIARATGVSAETVYKAFGGKPGLVMAVYERDIAGDEPLTTGERSAQIKEHERDPHRLVRAWGAFTAEVAPRIVPLMLLVRAGAATDADLAALWDQMNAQRLQHMSANARLLQRRGFLREGIGLAEARDILWAYSSPELFDLLVRRRGWTPARYGAWIGEMHAAALLKQR